MIQLWLHTFQATLRTVCKTQQPAIISIWCRHQGGCEEQVRCCFLADETHKLFLERAGRLAGGGNCLLQWCAYILRWHVASWCNLTFAPMFKSLFHFLSLFFQDPGFLPASADQLWAAGKVNPKSIMVGRAGPLLNMLIKEFYQCFKCDTHTHNQNYIYMVYIYTHRTSWCTQIRTSRPRLWVLVSACWRHLTFLVSLRISCSFRNYVGIFFALGVLSQRVRIKNTKNQPFIRRSWKTWLICSGYASKDGTAAFYSVAPTMGYVVGDKNQTLGFKNISWSNGLAWFSMV